MVSSLNWMCSCGPPKIIAARRPLPMGRAWDQFCAGAVYQRVSGWFSAKSLGMRTIQARQSRNIRAKDAKLAKGWQKRFILKGLVKNMNLVKACHVLGSCELS